MSALAHRRELGPGAPDAALADLQRQLGFVLATLGAAVGPAGSQSAVPPLTAGMPSDDVRHAPVELDELPNLISVTVAANVLGISRASAYRYAANGDLPTVRLGGRRYVVTARLKALLDAA